MNLKDSRLLHEITFCLPTLCLSYLRFPLLSIAWLDLERYNIYYFIQTKHLRVKRYGEIVVICQSIKGIVLFAWLQWWFGLDTAHCHRLYLGLTYSRHHQNRSEGK
jgi:hypothetical protein